MNVQVLSDQVLLNHYLSGDRSAISQLIERHSRRVKDYIHMMVKDRDVADDIFQETFIKAVRVIDEGRYTDNGKFLSWILRIAHNQVIDHFRAQRQNKSVSESEAGYDVLGTLKLAERTVEDAMVCEQIERDVRALGRTAARRTARSGDDALFLGSEFQGYSRADQREYQHRAGAHALCAHQPAENDQRKKSDSELTLHNNPRPAALYEQSKLMTGPMEDIDKNEVSDNGISEDEDLMMREVIQGDADLCYLHHYLSEVFRNGDNF